MNRIPLVLISIIFLSCSTGNPNYVEIPSEQHEEEKIIRPSVVSDFNAEEFFLSRNFDIIIDSIEPSIPKISLDIDEPEIIDPVLHLINLKKKYFIFNQLKESQFQNSEVSAISAFDGNYYLGTVRGAVFQSHIESAVNTIIKRPYNSLQNRKIKGFVRMGSLLFIASSSGLFTYNVETKQLVLQSDSLFSGNISSICRVEDTLLLGAVDGKLYEWSRGNYTLIGDVGKIQINAIEFLNGRIFLGTNGKGLYEYIRDENKCVSLIDSTGRSSNVKINFITYFDDKYWIGSPGNGVYTFDSDLAYGANIHRGRWILSTAQSDRYLYFGTHSEGLIFYDKIDKKWGSWGVRNGLSSLYIPSLFFLDNNLYISTPDKGIVIINEKIHGQNL